MAIRIDANLSSTHDSSKSSDALDSIANEFVIRCPEIITIFQNNEVVRLVNQGVVIAIQLACGRGV